MPDKLINVGYGNIVAGSRVIAVVAPDSSPSRRLIANARETGMLIDATCGRRTRAIIITDSNHIILSALLPETISSRFNEYRQLPGEHSNAQGK